MPPEPARRSRPTPGTSCALPRSLLHVQFLIDNGVEPDVILLRDDALADRVEQAFPGRLIRLGRERRPARTIAGLLAARHHNRAFYRNLETIIHDRRIDHVILFLEGEPLERFVVDLPAIRTIELWEDGLSHYIDLTSNAWYAARGVVQALAGFYPRGIVHRRMDRRGVLIRDRLEQRNLVLHTPPIGVEWRDELLLIGSPLVEDGIISRARLIAGVAAVASAAGRPVRYLPHPREDVPRLTLDLAAIPHVTVEPDRDGLIAHAGRYRYTIYGAAISTGLLDLGQWQRSIFLPRLFGLTRMARALSAWPANPIHIADTPEMLAQRIETLAAAWPGTTGGGGIA